MGRPDFPQCAAWFIGNNSINDTRFQGYVHHGRVQGISPNTTTQITYDGCRNLCGTGAAYYSWGDVASTITTWTLPVVGVILQAPFESNEFWATVFCLARWIGNPISSLSYTLWNMKVTGKCALLIDLAVASNADSRLVKAGTSDFSQMRDSLYILAAMNQFSVHEDMNRFKCEAETLLRIALFSRGLHKPGTTERFLIGRRQYTATRLRVFRKRGIVPVFISTMWFLFALCLSIQGAFDLLGVNATAHNLAMGFLLGWLPILFLSFIVDRNFTSVHDVREHLNELVKETREALSDEVVRDQYIQTYQGRFLGVAMRERIMSILAMPQSTEEFFVKYAGQGRLRWHYGVAHPILTDIERNFIRNKGRAWLSFNEQEARSNLVLGDTNERGLMWFDFRELWQVGSAMVIVLGTITGAFILSFFEPTVGLGCRSGGYMIFAIFATLLLLLEIGCWYFNTTTEHNPSLADKYRIDKVLKFIRNAINTIDSVIVHSFCTIANKDEEGRGAVQKNQKRRLEIRRQRELRDWAEILIFRPFETGNLIWLCYIVMAQTVGSYQTCECQCSTWGGANYMDFNNYDFSAFKWLNTTWTAATIVTCTIIGLSMIYIVVEWCLQSHLSTENYDAALRGLRRTRNFRRLTWPYRRLVDRIIRMMTTRRSVVWTYDITYQIETGMPQRRLRLDSVPQILIHPGTLDRKLTSDSVVIVDVEGDDIHLQTRLGRHATESSSTSRASSAGQQTSFTGLLRS